MNAAAAARAVGLSVRGLYAQLARHGIRPRRRGVFDEKVLAQLRQAQENQHKSMSILEAAAELGVSKTTMLRAMRAASIPRPSGTRTITPHFLDEIRRAVNRYLTSPGVSGARAAQMLGISRGRLWSLTHRHQIVFTDTRAFTPSVLAQLREALAQEQRERELSAQEAAESLGVSKRYLYQLLRRHGIQRPRGTAKFSQSLVARVRSLLPDGSRARRGASRPSGRHRDSMSLAAVADRLGVSIHVLHRVMRVQGIRRPAGPITDHLEERLRSALADQAAPGLTTAAFAHQLGLSHDALRYRCLTLGIRLDRKWPFTPAVIAEYHRRWAQHEKRRRRERGRTAVEVAAELGCSPGHVSKMVVKHNIPKERGVRKFTDDVVRRLRAVLEDGRSGHEVQER